MLKAHVTDWTLTGLLALHALAIIGACMMVAALMRQQPMPGWAKIRPSGMHWFAATGSWAFSLLISWVWLFVGSARADAADQMFWAYVLATAFAAAAAYTFFYMALLFHRRLRWNRNQLSWSAGGGNHQHDLKAIVDMESTWTGAIRLRFADNATLAIDPYATGADALLQALAAHAEESLFGTDDGPVR